MKKETEIFKLIREEQKRQERGIELIASENYVSNQVMKAMGSVLTNKYAEGYPGKRYYGGCEVVDKTEQLAIDRAKALFGAEWVNVQPHSGAQANASVMFACIKPGDKILGFNLSHGGHLTHGSPVNYSGKLYKPVFYNVEQETGKIDFNKLYNQVLEEKPKLIILGASAYSRDWNYELIRKAADQTEAILMADIAHPAGLIAKGILNDALLHCHIVTTTTHKTLRGPRGGMIMIKKDFVNPFGEKTPKGELKMMSALLDSAVFPGIQGGPLEHVIAAKAVAFGEALTDDYMYYAIQIVKNAQAMAKTFISKGYYIVSGGTDNHLMLIDLRNKGISGKEAEKVLGEVDITVNKNMVPFDDKSPFITSGIRIGTPAITSRGLKEKDCIKVVDLIDETFKNKDNPKVLSKIKKKVNQMMLKYPLFAE